eukprot:6731318-Pyramimonas_sp.AAC.2
MNLDDNIVIQGIQFQDQLIGYNHKSPLPNGVAHIRTRLHWKPPAPVLIGQKGQRPRPRRV